MREIKWLALSAFVLGACGGSSNATNPNPAGSSSSSPTASATTSSATPAPSASVAVEETYDDPNESSTPIVMQPLLTKATPKSTYPKSKVAEADCWKTVSFTGQHDKDFAALIASCGAPTGLAEYVKPADGKLHHIKDASDSFAVKLAGGLCYRYFAVADGSIKDIDIIVLKNGSILASDTQTQPVAIIEATKSWCMDADGAYQFDVKVKGEGHGAYTFGIWARPK